MNTNDKSIQEYCRRLLIMSKEGNEVAEEELIKTVRDKLMGRRIGRYVNRNRQVENDDLKQEFLIGLAMGIKDVDMEIGDPLEYIIHRGMYRVRGYMRKQIVQNTVQVCKECSTKTRLNKIGDQYICRKCGSINVDTNEVYEYDETFLGNLTERGFEGDVVSEMMMEDFKATLDPSTNVYKVYEALESGIYDDPSVKNYIKEIAKILGGCSNQNVVQNLQKLRERFEKWLKLNY